MGVNMDYMDTDYKEGDLHQKQSMIYYGVSTGESGQYGVGDIVEGSSWQKVLYGYEINDEPVFQVFTIVDNKLVDVT
jgi:hypothetical protein